MGLFWGGGVYSGDDEKKTETYGNNYNKTVFGMKEGRKKNKKREVRKLICYKHQEK